MISRIAVSTTTWRGAFLKGAVSCCDGHGDGEFFFGGQSEAYRNLEIRHLLVIFDDFCVFGQTG